MHFIIFYHILLSISQIFIEVKSCIKNVLSLCNGSHVVDYYRHLLRCRNLSNLKLMCSMKKVTRHSSKKSSLSSMNIVEPMRAV